MKNGKKPTRKQSEAIKAAGWDPDNWLVYKVERGNIHIIHRYAMKETKVVPA